MYVYIYFYGFHLDCTLDLVSIFLSFCNSFFLYMHSTSEDLNILSQFLTDLKGEIGNSTVIVGDFNTSLSTIDHPDRKSIRKHWTWTIL